MAGLSRHFPPRPPSFRGRSEELETLAETVDKSHPTAIALVGGGGSGKSTLAAALGYRLAPRFDGRVEWFRVGAWSTHTLATMLALRFGTDRRRPVVSVQRHLRRGGDRLIVLDNHEDDAAVAELLDSLRAAPVTWVITARRCLLGGVSVYPVSPPLSTRRTDPFPRVRNLTRLLRWNTVALSIADALVAARAVTARSLRSWLIERGVERIVVIRDEDDLPEVALLVEWVWRHLDPPERRMMGVLAHAGGDHVDRRSLLSLARAPRRSGLDRLRRWRLVQEPFSDRFALHATVARAIASRTRPIHRRHFEHYVGLLERTPERLEEEQTHLFAAMDYAQEQGDLASRLRIAALIADLGL